MKLLNRRFVLVVVLLGMVALTMVAPYTRAQAAGGRLRIVHALPGTAAVDVSINNVVAARGLEFGSATRYLSVNAANYTISVAAAGSTTSIFQTKAAVNGGQAITLVIQGTPTAVELGLFEDDLGPVAPGNMRLTAIHAIKDAPAVDVLKGDGSPLIQGLKYNTPYGSFDIPAATSTIAVVPAGGPLTGAIVKAENLSLVAGTYNTLIAVGTVTGSVKPTYALLSSATDPDKPAANSLVRFVHAAADAQPVDVYVGGKLIIPALAFGVATPHVALDASAGEVVLRAAGSAPESDKLLSVPSLSLAGGTAGTVVVTSEGAALKAAVVADNVSTLDPKQARVNVINAVGGKATFKFADKSLNSDAKNVLIAEMPAGNYDTEVSVDTPALSLKNKLSLSGGVLYDLVIAGNDKNSQLIVASTSINEQAASAPAAAVVALKAQPAQPVAAQPTAGGDTQAAPTQDTATEAAAPTVAPTAAPVQPTKAPAQPTKVAQQPTVAPTEAPAPTEPPAQPTQDQGGDVVPVEPAQPTQPVGQPAQPVQIDAVTGVVFNLNEGVNLKLREYPFPEAKTLALLPKDTSLVIQGIMSPRKLIAKGTGFVTATIVASPAPRSTTAATPTLNPTGIAFDDIWLYVQWNTPDGGTVTGWVPLEVAGQQYIKLSRGNKELKTLPDVLALRVLASNIPGEISTGVITAVPPPSTAILGVVKVDEGRNLQMRRTPGTDGESLFLLPAGVQLNIIAKVELKAGSSQPGTIWYWVRYQTDNGAVVGWVNSQYIDNIVRNGKKIDLELDIPVVKTIERGYTEGNASQVKPPPAAGLIATVDQVNQGVNLQLRRDPKSTAESLGLIPANSQLPILGRNGDGVWLKVRYNAVEGWINSQFVTITRGGKKANVAEITIITGETNSAGTVTPGPSPTPRVVATTAAPAPSATK